MSVGVEDQKAFDLNEEMMKTIGEEFDVQSLAGTFADATKDKSGDALEKTAEELFGQYGVQWMKRTMELGEKYSDTTYETMIRVIEKTGCMYFPLVPQRSIEIAYLGTQSIFTLPIVQNNGEKLTYKLAMCDTFKAVRENCGEGIADSLPCRHACLQALETLFQDLDLAVTIDMEATMPKDDYCQFSATKV